MRSLIVTLWHGDENLMTFNFVYKGDDFLKVVRAINTSLLMKFYLKLLGLRMAGQACLALWLAYTLFSSQGKCGSERRILVLGPKAQDSWSWNEDPGLMCALFPI